MQCNSTRFITGTLLNFLGLIKNYPACRPAACKKFQQSQLGLPCVTFFRKIYYSQKGPCLSFLMFSVRKKVFQAQRVPWVFRHVVFGFILTPLCISGDFFETFCPEIGFFVDSG